MKLPLCVMSARAKLSYKHERCVGLHSGFGEVDLLPNHLEDTGSIGITFGSSALEENTFADRGLFWHNVTSGVAAANFAAINSENLLVIENYVRGPGHRNARFGGGVCCFDLETNSHHCGQANVVENNRVDGTPIPSQLPLPLRIDYGGSAKSR